MKYIKKYASAADQQTAISNGTICKPFVCLAINQNNCVYDYTIEINNDELEVNYNTLNKQDIIIPNKLIIGSPINWEIINNNSQIQLSKLSGNKGYYNIKVNIIGEETDGIYPITISTNNVSKNIILLSNKIFDIYDECVYDYDIQITSLGSGSFYGYTYNYVITNDIGSISTAISSNSLVIIDNKYYFLMTYQYVSEVDKSCANNPPIIYNNLIHENMRITYCSRFQIPLLFYGNYQLQTGKINIKIYK